MIRHVDHRLVRPVDQLGLVLHAQHEHLLAVLLLLADRVDDRRDDLAREALVAVGADQGELYALAALEAVDARDLARPDGRGAVPDLLAPADDAAVQVVGAVVRGEGVRLSAVEAVEAGATDAVGHAADGLAEEGVVVRLVVGLFGEALDDVDAADVQGLDDGPEGEEGHGGVGHGEVGGLCLVGGNVGGGNGPSQWIVRLE